RARVEPEPIHQALTRAIRRCLERGDHGPVSDLITQAARERRFLG
ncbi:MAG: hypothetical protein HYZ53_22440, partial [Planctomycetes bacterium]|nr:hypothetical protein [Planctomycetota bacterium]